MNAQKILMPTDFSECANAALNHALFLAGHLEAELHLLHVVVLHNMDPYEEVPGFPDADEVHRRLEKVASGEMKELLAGHSADHLEVRQAQKRAVAAAPAIVEYAAEENVDLIVMGAHGRRGFRRFLLGSVAEEVVRLSPCPVLTIRGEGKGKKTELEKPEKILVPFDFSGHSRRALETARELAASYGGKLHVLHVIEPVMEPHPYVPVHYRPEGFDLPRLMSRVKEDLGPIVAEIAAGVSYEIGVDEGNPAWCIAETAEKVGADLIVIATHGRTGLGRFFLGSVTEKVVRTAGCPVLTLKADVED